MRPSGITNVFALAPPVYLMILFLFNWQYRKNIARIFDSYPSDGPALDAVRNILPKVNEESSWMFTAEKLVTISYQNQKLSIIYGRVGSISPSSKGGMWSTKKCLFSVVTPNQAIWMRANKQLFTQAVAGSDYVVFWVNVSKLNAYLITKSDGSKSV